MKKVIKSYYDSFLLFFFFTPTHYGTDRTTQIMCLCQVLNFFTFEVLHNIVIVARAIDMQRNEPIEIA